MKRFPYLIVCMLIGCMPAAAQNNNLTKEINEQVWKPFIKGLGNKDDETFRSVHSKDVVRVIRDNNDIFGYDKYFQKLPDSIKAKRADWSSTIELRFTQRIAAGDKAFETGYYKTTSTNRTTGEVRKGIGQFHVLLRKENGTWKIVMDADTSEGANEEVFAKANAME
jgi:ketosteroid isomerase-like protein